MNLLQLVAVTLVCAFTMQESAMVTGFGYPGLRQPIKATVFGYSGAFQSNQATDQNTREQQFQARRAHFNSGRELLLDKGVPFEPEELLRDEWPKKLKDVLNGMPEMQEVHYETAPLQGAYITDTLYLPENVRLTGHTIILTRNLVFEGNHPVIKGPYDLHIFPTEPVSVLGTTLAQALRKKAGLLNVKFGGMPALPSFSLIHDLKEGGKHFITFDTSGLDPQPAKRLNRRPAANLLPAAWSGFEPALFQSGNRNTSGAPGDDGSLGISPNPAPDGITPPKSPNGDCSNPASESNMGDFGIQGGNGAPGTNGGGGGIGGPGFNAGDINITVPDGDTGQYIYIANGGRGGQGGQGGNGGKGGSGAKGGDGGDGVACGCQLGNGGAAGRGGNGNTGGNGGPGNTGGSGGNGGSINVSLPFNSPGVASTSNFNGGGGRGGDGGGEGPGGSPGAAGQPGTGATACGQTGAPGAPNSSGELGASGTPGTAGAIGANGINGPPPNITFRSQPGGGFVGGCGNVGGDGFNPNDGGAGNDGCSPVIIDTEGEGFHLTSAENGVTFDIRGDGHPLKVAWTAPGSHNAFLVLDRTGDGLITSGKELFGNFTAQPASNQPNGFLALAEFDKPQNGGNGDGVIDERDTVYSKLRLWIDENHDGVCQPNELHTLSELGVLSLSLNYFQAQRVDQFGNQFRYKAKVNPNRHDRRDEASAVGRWSYDVFLTTVKP